MFSFEGDFKTRPKVSLGGASRKKWGFPCSLPHGIREWLLFECHLKGVFGCG
ncbi:hypothetical protein H8959_007775, partial [Pygathrix nigripes]